MVSSAEPMTSNPKSAPARAKEMNGDQSELSDPEDNSDMDLLKKLEEMQRTLREQEEKIASQEKRMKEEEENRKKSESEMKKRLDDEKKEMKRKEKERMLELMRQEEERMKELKRKEEELQRKEEERMAELEREKELLAARERDLGDREERISILENRSDLGETDTESEIGAHGRKGRRRSSVPDSRGSTPCGCYEVGFQNCIKYGKHECQCSYSCKFVKGYYEDTQDLSEASRKVLNSSWEAKRKISAEQREKRKAAELEAQKAMWTRIQEEMAKDEGKGTFAEEEEEHIKEIESEDDKKTERKQVEIEAA